MTPERVQEIYSELQKLVIDLDPNPTARGAVYLQDLISRTRGYLNQTSFYFQEILEQKHLLEMTIEAKEAAFQVSADELLVTDNRVKLLPNIEDRRAMINLLLGSERREIQELQVRLKNLGHVEKVVRHRHKELENTMSAIRLQRSLMETEVRLGTFYGDESETSRGSRLSPKDIDIDSEELDNLLRQAEQQLTSSDTPKESLSQDIVSGVVKDAVSESIKVDEDPAIGKFLDGDDLEEFLKQI